VKLTRPDAAEVTATAGGVASVVAPAGGLTDLQRMLLEALFPAMTEHRVDLSHYEPMTVDELAEVPASPEPRIPDPRCAGRSPAALVLRPLPPDVAARIVALAQALGVDEGMLEVAPGRALGGPRLPAEGTLGNGVWRLYRAHGVVFPEAAGSAPPLLAQHDWVHVLGDYGTRVESEVEVFALMARANDDMRAFSLLAMVVSLFETGYLRTGAGLFQSDVGHLSGHSAGHAMSIRLADAMRRGAWCHDRETGSDSIDFLRQDWFALTPLPIDEVRGGFGLRPKAPEAIAAGSAGPWATGGISPFQLKAGRAMAAAEDREYASYGASPD
jgi:hypothetical protein